MVGLVGIGAKWVGGANWVVLGEGWLVGQALGKGEGGSSLGVYER